MLILYGLLACMLIAALILLAIPFVKYQEAIKSYCVIASFTIVFTATLYFTIGKPNGLEDWLTQGQNHYRLLVEMNRLGGIDGIIHRIQIKLHENPNDIQGWIILGKMYLMKQDPQKAEEAFSKANELKMHKSHISF